jgi:hypothetical protein
MIYNFFSFFLISKEIFFKLNLNLLETNIINILLVFSLLIHSYKISLSQSLIKRKKKIIQIIENTKRDLLKATNYFNLMQNGFIQSSFWLLCWKAIYEKNKVNIIKNKYHKVKSSLLEKFITTENLINNFEKKTFLTFQRYIIFLTASQILRKFLFLTEIEKSKLIEIIILKLQKLKK